MEQTKNNFIQKRKSFSRHTWLMLITLMVFSISSVFATDMTLFTGLQGASSTFISEIVTTVNKSIFPIWLGISFLLLLFKTNQKMADAALMSLKIGVCAFIGLNSINIIVNTLIWIAGLINGTV